jgi:hypothetical protein
MPVYHVTSPDGQTIEVTAPEGATEQDAIAYAQANMPKPTLGQNIASGINKAGQAISEYNPFTSTAELAAHLGSGAIATPVAGLAGLAATGAHALGANVDPAAVVRTIQEHGTYQPRTAGGQLMTGAVDKVAGLVPKAGNWVGEHAADAATAAGASPELAAGIGAGANTITQAVPMALGAKSGAIGDAAWNGVKKVPGASAVGDWINPEATATRLLKQYAGSPADQAQAAAAIDLHKSGQSGALATKYGYQPTTAEVADNEGLAQMERTLRNQPETAPTLNNATKANNATTAGNLQQMTVDEQGRNAEALDHLRDVSTKKDYENALNNPTNAVPTTPAMSAATPGIDEAAAATGPGQTSAGLNPNGQRLQEVMQRPAMVDAMAASKREAGNRGITLDENNLIQNLHYAKMALDGQISQAIRAGNNVTAAGLMDTKNTLLGVMNDIEPKYAEASAKYRAFSAPLNRVQTGEALRQKYTSAMNDASGTGSTPATFVNAVNRNGDQVARTATGFNGATLENTMSPGDLESLRAITDHLGRQNYAQNAGRGVGSNTAQNLANEKALNDVGSLRASLGPVGNLFLGLHHPIAALTDTLLGDRSRSAVRQRLSQMATDPQAAAAALRAARPSLQTALPPLPAGVATVGAMQTPATQQSTSQGQPSP